jgi:aminoglycoside phosphotransferase (APT) family kinase protein
MLRPKAMSDIVNGEQIATVAARYIPALPAKQFDEKAVLEIDGQYYMVYDWVDGKSLYGENKTPTRCEQIGNILGKLHTIDFSSLNIPKPAVAAEALVDWDRYLHKGQEAGSPWIDELSANMDNLQDWNHRYLASMKYLEKPLVIGHGDIDPKNVMWSNDKPIIIDWESAGYLNPSHELIVYALYWSDMNEKIDNQL